MRRTAGANNCEKRLASVGTIKRVVTAQRADMKTNGMRGENDGRKGLRLYEGVNTMGVCGVSSESQKENKIVKCVCVGRIKGKKRE